MLHIKSSIPMLVNIKEDYTLQYPTDHIDLNEDSNLMLKCYPLIPKYNGKSTIPYSLLINTNELINNPRYKYTLYPNNHHEITLLPFCIQDLPHLKQTYNIQNSSKTLIIKSSPETTSFYIKDNSNMCFFDSKYSLIYKSSLELNGKIYILTQQDINYHLCVIKDSRVLFCGFLTDAAYQNNHLSAILPLNDMAKHGVAFDINCAKPYSAEIKTIYPNNKPKLTTISQLIPYAFLEALKQDNYNLAKYYLSPLLKSKLTNSTLKEFFGEYVSITHDIYNDSLCLIYDNASCYIAKDYTFEQSFGKISNINEV